MGLFKFVFYPILFMGGTTYCAFSLGSRQLSLAARNTGRSLGMGYNYFKVGLRFFTPETETANQIVNQYRKGSQQAHAFTREFKSSIVSQKAQLEKIVPEFGQDPIKELNEILQNPLKEFNDTDQDKKDNLNNKKNGSQLLLQMEQQRREIVARKFKKRSEEEQYLKF